MGEGCWPGCGELHWFHRELRRSVWRESGVGRLRCGCERMSAVSASFPRVPLYSSPSFAPQKEQSKKFNALVDAAPTLIKDLPWGPDFEGDYTALLAVEPDLADGIWRRSRDVSTSGLHCSRDTLVRSSHSPVHLRHSLSALSFATGGIPAGISRPSLAIGCSYVLISCYSSKTFPITTSKRRPLKPDHFRSLTIPLTKRPRERRFQGQKITYPPSISF